MTSRAAFIFIFCVCVCVSTKIINFLIVLHNSVPVKNLASSELGIPTVYDPLQNLNDFDKNSKNPLDFTL